MNVVDEVKQRLDITEYIGRHVHLEKSGRYYKGLCPFHTEKTPSFFVFPDSQNWHCFGCDQGGDLYTFVMEMNGLDFRTALEELAREAGVQLRSRTEAEIQAENEADRLRQILQAAVDYYHTLLLTSPQAKHARAYLRDRGFTRETLETFQLGYSMDSWDAARTHLSGAGFTVEDQIKAGMLVQRDDGRTYDRFRDRVMIPIHDRRGRPIAFGGRVLDPDDQPKYMNSPQTPLFDKGRVLFGYHLASQAIRQEDAAIIVEGYMDVMIPYQAGYRNVVAPMGTSLSEAHLEQLQRLTRRYILALDPDEAGIHGTLQGLETARQTLDRDMDAIFDARGLVGYEGRLKADIRVITLPDGRDPDELILEDRERWDALLASSQPVVRFYFQHMLDQGDPSEPKMKSRIVDAMLPLLSDIGDSIERESYIQEIAQTLALEPRMLLDRLRARERAEAIHSEAAVRRVEADRIETPRPINDLEAHLLTVFLNYPEVMRSLNAHFLQNNPDGEIWKPITASDFNSDCRLIWSAINQVRRQPEYQLEDFLPSDMLGRVEEWKAVQIPEKGLGQWERDATRTLLRIRERNLRSQKRKMDTMLMEAQAAGDLEGMSQALQAIQKLTTSLKQIQTALARKPVQA